MNAESHTKRFQRNLCFFNLEGFSPLNRDDDQLDEDGAGESEAEAQQTAAVHRDFVQPEKVPIFHIN
jgi:hypothetical protein